MAEPSIDSILIENFPEYVRDMLQNKEEKIKTEFMVGFSVWMYNMFMCV